MVMPASLSPAGSAGNGRLFRIRDLVLFVAAFLAVRVLYARAGVWFDARSIDFLAQLLDPPLLQNRLIESLWFLHAQPPLFNLLTGLALGASPSNPGAPLHVVFVLAGLGCGLFVAAILREIGFGRLLALAAALAFTSTPAFVLFEHWYFYPHLEQLLILAAAFAFLRTGGRAGPALGAAFALLAALVLLRSLFVPLFLVLAAAAAAAIVPRPERAGVARAAAVPLLVVLAWAAKNWFLFGFFGTSSWGGNSLHRMMTESIPAERVEAMIAAGSLHPISRAWEFAPPEEFVRILGKEAGEDRGVPALDRLMKTRTRENPFNYNHWSYPAASRVLRRDALTLLRAEPSAYLASIGWTARRFLDPVTDDPYLQAIRYPIRKLARAAERVETGAVARFLGAAAILGGAVLLARRRLPAVERLLLAFALGTVLWVGLFGIAFEFGENNRFRHPIGGLILLLAAIGARELGRAVLQRWERAPLLGE